MFKHININSGEILKLVLILILDPLWTQGLFLFIRINSQWNPHLFQNIITLTVIQNNMVMISIQYDNYKHTFCFTKKVRNFLYFWYIRGVIQKYIFLPVYSSKNLFLFFCYICTYMLIYLVLTSLITYIFHLSSSKPNFMKGTLLIRKEVYYLR
jgi:hypothetical protein